MLKGRGRDPRGVNSPAPAPFNMRPTTLSQPRTPQQRQPMKPEPDYEVVEFPSDQYVNAKLQPPPPPPPRPPTGHPAQVGGPCGLCGGGGARVRCAECGRRALCASCDDMYHRHPKRRHHQRQALSPSQLSDVRPPLPPKTAAAPIPPPRRHKMSASPKPPMTIQDQRHATLGHIPSGGNMRQQASPTFIQHQPTPVHIQNKLPAPHQHPSHIGSMPFLNTMPNPPAPAQSQTSQTHTMAHFNSAWNRPRGSLQGFNMPQMLSGAEAWDEMEGVGTGQQGWGRPIRRGASVLELGGAGACAGCTHCAPAHAPGPWRYGSCASLDHPWAGAAWPSPGPPCCAPHPHHQHAHLHPSQTPQPYRRAESRTMSRAASRAGSRAASPALSVRSRTSRRTKHRTPSPPPLPSSDADSESDSEGDPPLHARRGSRTARPASRDSAPPPALTSGDQFGTRKPATSTPLSRAQEPVSAEETLGPAPAPAAGPWCCEHCTFLNEAGVRVCAVCCRTPTAAPRVLTDLTQHLDNLNIAIDDSSTARVRDSPRIDVRDAEEPTRSESVKSNRERTSTGCGPSPPREPRRAVKAAARLVTPSREQNGSSTVERPQSRQEMAVGPSPPRDSRDSYRQLHVDTSLRDSNKTVRVSPYRETKEHLKMSPQRHSVLVGPSPPREAERHNVSVGPSPPREQTNTRESSTPVNFQKKSAGTSPPHDVSAESRPTSAPITKTNVSNTGTSPPPQSISTQTYEDPSTWGREREGASTSVGTERTRSSRRRLRDEARRERSRSRHSLSSDTRESERSVRTTGGGSWEWRERERDVSPPASEWGGGVSGGRLARRASHLDLRRARNHRRSGYYGSQAASPEPVSGRAVSMEALAGTRAPRATMQLSRLLADAERLGYDAAEVAVAVEASPEAPLEWLRSRWAGLAGAVCGAAARLAPHAPLAERDARAALARHRGAVWPAVTECVHALRGQRDGGHVSGERRVRGRVWGSPTGAEDDAAAPRVRAEYSSDECDLPAAPGPGLEHEWGFAERLVPLDGYEQTRRDSWGSTTPPPLSYAPEEVARTLRSLARAGLPYFDENLLLRGLASDAARTLKPETERKPRVVAGGLPSFDFIQSENDFIDAYNALTRASPLPNVGGSPDGPFIVTEPVISNERRENDFLQRVDDMRGDALEENDNASLARTSPLPSISRPSHEHQILPESALSNVGNEHVYRIRKDNEIVREERPDNMMRKDDEVRRRDDSTINESSIKETKGVTINIATENNVNSASFEGSTSTKIVPKLAKIRILQSDEHNVPSTVTAIPNVNAVKAITENQRHEIKSPMQLVQKSRQIEEKSGNLNDLVDNTQKLIQQMKDEINSDINSLDDGHAQTSQSEHDTSSNDEREESSYSDTEEDTDNITSDEREISSNGEYDEKEEDNHSRNPKTFANRTSSEDNEQFEEALDNLDNQIEDVKHANIEILDSIARSLQEEHKISIEFNDKKERLRSQEKAEPHIITKTNETNVLNSETNKNNEVLPNNNIYKQQDSNNNSFVTVNTFDEIYAELNTSINSIKKKNYTEPLQLVKDNAVIMSSPVSPKVQPTKHAIYELVFKAVKPSKLVILEQIDPVYNAIVETIEVIEEIQDNIKIQAETNIEQEVVTNNEQLNNDRSSSESSSSRQSEKSGSNNILEVFPNDVNTEIDHIEAINEDVAPVHFAVTNDELPSREQDTLSSVEKVAKASLNDTNANKTVIGKSNIPKPVKTTLSIRAKADKLAPKLLVSKVPVRRTSLKQYPAPSPPKTHFGNVQSGHVKQLQSKILNSVKTAKPQTSVTIEVKPSTSNETLKKKKPAPPPPVHQSEQKEPSPAKASPLKQKRNNYFRETCRTEDEWTDSDSEDSQMQIVKTTERREEEPVSPPSPPPPITLRRVSGQIIDLANVQLPEGSPERQARMLLAAGATESWEQARLAVELVGRGTAPPAALLAALECADLSAALVYLHQDCELCATRLPEHEMVSMLRCTHRCCRECARLYFTVQITERSIADCVCPYCKVPELEALPEDAWLEYFAHLDILLKTLLETDVHELFQRKLRDRTLARDPNFRWCMECSSGFFVHPKHKKLRCPECRSVSCASCRKPWSPNHEGLSCEQYTAWLEDNDPERSVAAVQQHLRENGLECPRCHFKYSLSRGGCMHFTCTQCKFEFCYGCGKPFTMGARCGLSEYCAKLGLHAHHPRNCLFYLRDKEPHELQTLLQMNNVEYATEAGEGGGRCPIQLQRETPAGLVDGLCGSEAPSNYAGLCKNHYLEYLCRVVRARGVDPLPLLAVDDLETLVRRAALRPPPRPYGSLEGLYKRALTEIVKEKIPLD